VTAADYRPIVAQIDFLTRISGGIFSKGSSADVAGRIPDVRFIL
jgi:hypothetical protein